MSANMESNEPSEINDIDELQSIIKHKNAELKLLNIKSIIMRANMESKEPSEINNIDELQSIIKRKNAELKLLNTNIRKLGVADSKDLLEKSNLLADYIIQLSNRKKELKNQEKMNENRRLTLLRETVKKELDDDKERKKHIESQISELKEHLCELEYKIEEYKESIGYNSSYKTLNKYKKELVKPAKVSCKHPRSKYVGSCSKPDHLHRICSMNKYDIYECEDCLMRYKEEHEDPGN
jgi:hypothetical protein